MSDTPRTDAIIAAADACPETRIVFLIHQLANLAKDLERKLGQLSPADNSECGVCGYDCAGANPPVASCPARNQPV